MPSLFISHGAPTYALEPGVAGAQLAALGASMPRPKAVVVVSPHWTTREVQVTTAHRPETIHDFGGFDRALYALRYPAEGHPAMARRACQLLSAAGWPATPDEQRGLDHGAWVPMRHLYPGADVPVFQVSMPARLDARSSYAFGQALRPLADEQVLIIGSGSMTHNLHEFRRGHDHEPAYAREFAAWVRQAVLEGDHELLLNTFELAPHARRAHPSAEHLLPLFVAAGAAGLHGQADVLDGGYTHGVLSMESYVFGARREPSQTGAERLTTHA